MSDAVPHNAPHNIHNAAIVTTQASASPCPASALPLLASLSPGPGSVVARAPGRVNLLGEHVDYSGYGVLPMAIEAQVLASIAEVPDEPGGQPGGPTVTVSNADPRFEPRTYPADPNTELDLADFSWAHYFMCGYKGALASFPGPPPKLRSLEVKVSGNVPSGAGLSSSSAFVVASALATAARYEVPLSRTSLAEAAIAGELHCGTLSGGMDQAASILALPGRALHIRFVPGLTAEPVELPGGVAFVICNCLRRKEKAVDSSR